VFWKQNFVCAFVSSVFWEGKFFFFFLRCNFFSQIVCSVGKVPGKCRESAGGKCWWKVLVESAGKVPEKCWKSAGKVPEKCWKSAAG
jgi:hypothetical protein